MAEVTVVPGTDEEQSVWYFVETRFEDGDEWASGSDDKWDDEDEEDEGWDDEDDDDDDWDDDDDDWEDEEDEWEEDEAEEEAF